MRSLFEPKSLAIVIAAAILVVAASGCGPRPESGQASIQTGIASYYSNDFDGRQTADGEIFDNAKMTAAHRTYPFGTIVRVTNLATDATVEVRINDRGPAKRERVIDLTEAAARAIGIEREGLGRVRIQVVRWGKIS